MASDPGAPTTPDAELSGLSWRQLVRLAAHAPDSYVLLLFLLLADYVTLTVDWAGGAALVVRALFFAMTVLLAFHTSRVNASLQNVVRVLVVLTLLSTIGVAIAGGDEANGAVTFLISLLVFACPVAIGWRILQHHYVSGETIAGAVCIYILIGMIFATADYGLQLTKGSFFAQAGHHGLPDFAYFSYITMATVGYGDLTPTTGLPRTMSVMEALVGQVFLVVLLARLVSMYRGPSGWRRSLQERLSEEEEPPETGPAAGPAGPTRLAAGGDAPEA